jgi:hypothetical protein
MNETKNKRKRIWISIGLWVLAFLLTALIAVYQRMTGPTYPVRSTEIVNGSEISYKLLRSHIEFQSLPIEIKTADPNAAAYLNYKRYKTDDPWTEQAMQRDGDRLFSEIPGQPTAGKVEYSIRVETDGESTLLNEGISIVARFKGEVPLSFLIIHVILMFFSIMFALRTGMEALRKDGNFSWLVNWTLGITFVGGMILGPIVQEYAFGDYWTGFPFGTDLTDNKVLIAVIFWIAAFFLKKKSKWWVALATAVMIIIYLIPHSVLGAELDYQTGKMKNKYSYHIATPQTPPHKV